MTPGLKRGLEGPACSSTHLVWEACAPPTGAAACSPGGPLPTGFPEASTRAGAFWAVPPPLSSVPGVADSRCGCRPSRLGTGRPRRPLSCVLSAQHLALQGDRGGAVWLLRCGGACVPEGPLGGAAGAASTTEGARVLNVLYLRFFENLSLNFQPNFIFKLCRKTGCLLSILPSEIL